MDQYADTYRSHFHIRWEGKKTLDWECFRTHYAATVRAQELARTNEIFTIQEVSTNCLFLTLSRMAYMFIAPHDED